MTVRLRPGMTAAKAAEIADAEIQRHSTMTPVRACQVASELLQRNADSADTMEGTLGDPTDPRSYAAAIEVLRRVAASVITGGRPSSARSPRS